MADLTKISQLEGNLSRSHIQQIRSRCGSDLDRYQSELEQELASSNQAIARLNEMCRDARNKRI
ncbi:MAG: hypothetical protein WBA57_02935 [Elainellaceae cyanobacterium]